MARARVNYTLPAKNFRTLVYWAHGGVCSMARESILPANFQQGSPIGQSPNQTTTQLFYFDGVNAWPLGPGVLTP
jgi:hypothetical protein